MIRRTLVLALAALSMSVAMTASLVEGHRWDAALGTGLIAAAGMVAAVGAYEGFALCRDIRRTRTSAIPPPRRISTGLAVEVLRAKGTPWANRLADEIERGQRK